MYWVALRSSDLSARETPIITNSAMYCLQITIPHRLTYFPITWPTTSSSNPTLDTTAARKHSHNSIDAYWSYFLILQVWTTPLLSMSDLYSLQSVIDKQWMMWFCLCSSILSLPLLVILKDNFNRLDMETGGTNTNNTGDAETVPVNST